MYIIIKQRNMYICIYTHIYTSPFVFIVLGVLLFQILISFGGYILLLVFLYFLKICVTRNSHLEDRITFSSRYRPCYNATWQLSDMTAAFWDILPILSVTCAINGWSGWGGKDLPATPPTVEDKHFPTECCPTERPGSQHHDLISHSVTLALHWANLSLP